MVSIIGAGPAGSYTAYLLAKQGLDVNLYEEHKIIGKPVQCGGIITSKLKNIIGLPNKLIQNKIKYIQIIAPNQKQTTIKLNEPDLIIDRTEFDQHLADQAIAKGAKLHLKHKLLNQKNNKLKFKNKIITSEHIIGADGPNSIIGKSINQSVKKHFIGCQATIKDNFQKNLVKTFPIQQGFAWIIPTSETQARVGLLTYKNASSRLQKFINHQFPKSKILDRQGGLIPIYNPKLKTQKNNIYLIGDSAGMVKATTGGGIIPSLIAAKQLAKAITQNKNYDKLWKQKLHRSLWLHLFIRKTLNKFSHQDINKLIHLTNQRRVKQVLSRHNRDNNLPLVTNLILREPRYLLFLKNLL